MALFAPRSRRSIDWLRAALWWRVFVAADIVAALVIQIALVLSGGPDPNTGATVTTIGVAHRMVQTFSFFTIQSNILSLTVAATLIANPLRDGRIWRVLHLDALVGITVTGLVFDLALIHYVHPAGWQLVATIGLHYVAPWATVAGWVLFGPAPRIDNHSAAWMFLWPATWITYTFAHGAISHWYPYSFLDADRLGFWAALGSAMLVVLLAAVLLLVYRWLDRKRPSAAKPRNT